MAGIRIPVPDGLNEKFEAVMRAIEAAKALAISTGPAASTVEMGSCASAAVQPTSPPLEISTHHSAADRRRSLVRGGIAITTALTAILMPTLPGILVVEEGIDWTHATVSPPSSTSNGFVLLGQAGEEAVSYQGRRRDYSQGEAAHWERDVVATFPLPSMPSARSPTDAPPDFTNSRSTNTKEAAFTPKEEPAPHRNELKPLIASAEPGPMLPAAKSAANLDEWADAVMRELLERPNMEASDGSGQERLPEADLPASSRSTMDLETLHTLVPAIDAITVPPVPAVAPAEMGAEQFANPATELDHPSAPPAAAPSMAQSYPTVDAPTVGTIPPPPVGPAASDHPAQESALIFSTLPFAVQEQPDTPSQDSQIGMESSSEPDLRRVENSTESSEAELPEIARSEAPGQVRERIDALARELLAARDEIAALRSRIAPGATNWPPVNIGEAKPVGERDPGSGLPLHGSSSYSGRRDTPILTSRDTDTTAALRPDGMATAPSPIRPASPPESRLLARAEASIKEGDISGARLLLERALERGSSRAAFLLAETYDPRTLAGPHMRGAFGDSTKAQELYRRAYSDGIRQAGERLTAK